MTANPETRQPDPLQRLARLERHQEILKDFGHIAAETTSLSRLLQVACVQAGRGIGIRHTKVLRHRPTLGDLFMEAGVGWKPGTVGHATLGTDIASPAGRALQSRQPVCIDDLPNAPGFRYSPLLREHGIVSLLNVPVAADGIVWGVLEVDSGTPRHFGKDDVVFLMALANILGLAIQGMLQERHTETVATRALRDAERQQMLLREHAHRTKNDFQIIVALLLAQKGRHRDPDIVNEYRQIVARVTAISMAHDQLAMRPDQPTIEIVTYLTALCGSLEHRGEHVRVETRLDSADLSHEWAVCLGLITNELVTNALKHAFPDGKGTVRVEFTADPETGQGCLIVSDDGVGMGPPRSGSSGLRLVQGLAGQIGGTVEQEPVERGTRFCICFLLVR